MDENVKQSYAEQENPPTETMEEGVSLQTLWACVASEVGYGDYDTEVSLVDKIEDMEGDITGKADSSHTHSASSVTGLAEVATTGNYSDLNGTPDLAIVALSGNYNDLSNKPTAYTHPSSHPASMITGLADVATSGSYNDLVDKPTIPTVPTSLPANGGNADTVDNMHASEFATAGHTHSQYANATHSHAVSDVTGLATELDGKADADHTHNYAAASHTHTLDSVTETSTKKIMTGDERTKLSGVEAGANNYTHPATHAASMITGLSTVATSGSYDDLSDKPTTMTPAAHTHAQNEITGLASALSGKANTSHTHAQSDVTGLSDTLSGKANAVHTHDYAASTHTHSQTEVTGLATALSGKANATHTHAQSDVTGLTDALAGKADTSHVHTNYAASTHTHTQAQVTGLETALSDLEDAIDGKANATHTHAQSEVTGLTTALSGKANATHTHDEYINKSLQITADNGEASLSLPAGSTDNLLTKIEELGIGVHTFYSGSGNEGNPKTVEGWRGVIFKTSATQGFVQAYGSVGSVYTNYLDGTNGWRGWVCVYDCSPAPLWTGSVYMTSTHTITPSKTLSQCQHGWLLVWSDYDAGASANDYDFCSTLIPKRNATGQKWSGNEWLCDIPHVTGDTTSAEGRIIKKIAVHDDKLVGLAGNSAGNRNDVVLRAVYEF